MKFAVVQLQGKQYRVEPSIQELFEEPDCGCCQSRNIRCEVRHIDNNSYFKLVCADCTAQLDFGQKKDGKSLFIKRRDENKQPLPDRGWYVWQGKRE